MANRKYVPSEKIKKQIREWEGSSMRTNRSFEKEAKDFQQHLEKAGIFDQMSQDELDGLYSFSYNVGNNTFAERTLPYVVKLYNGTGSLQDVLKNIYGKRDSEPKMSGLRSRRKYERELFAKGYNARMQKLKTKPSYDYRPYEPSDKTRVELPEFYPIFQQQKQNKNQSYWQPEYTPMDQYIEYLLNNVPELPYYAMNEVRNGDSFIKPVLQQYYNGGKLIKKWVN